MKKSKMVVTLALLASVGLVGCQKNDTAKINELQKSIEEKDKKIAELNDKLKEAGGDYEKAEDAEKPGESGFEEIKIGEEKIVGPFQVATVYFQGVDMIPEGRQPSAAESDMHLEADIHLTKEAGKKYGFGSGKDIWPAYLTVNYKVLSTDGKEVTSGSMMPMNADDGAHYGTNIKKNVLKVGKYKLVIEIQPSADYLLHTDEETGVPAIKDGGKAAASKYYEKQTVEFEWNYTGQQLQNK